MMCGPHRTDTSGLKALIPQKKLLKKMDNKINQFYWGKIELIDIDHDAGDYGPPDYIKVLDWLEKTGRNYPIRIHSMNPVGVQNMRAIIQRNGWTEIR